MSQHIKPQKQAEYHPDELIFIQSRAEINDSIVNEYAEMMRDGVEFDPVSAIQEGDQIFVWDGSHRGEAAKKASMKLAVNIQPGTKQDAQWLALSANQKHGLRRTKTDEEWIVRHALLQFPDRSIREIHRHTGINRRKISRIRDDLIASGAIAPDNQVMVTRGGVTYRQDTTNIGSKPAQQTVQISEMPHQAVVASPHPNQNGHRSADTVTLIRQDKHADLTSVIKSDDAEHPPYQPQRQEFECPRCGAEKIVGVNGSRRWCLNCLAEWPTADAFLAEVSPVQPQNTEHPTHRQQLQSRFQNILARLDEPELDKINNWLDSLEAQLALPQEPDSIIEKIPSPMPEAAG